MPRLALIPLVFVGLRVGGMGNSTAPMRACWPVPLRRSLRWLPANGRLLPICHFRAARLVSLSPTALMPCWAVWAFIPRRLSRPLGHAAVCRRAGGHVACQRSIYPCHANTLLSLAAAKALPHQIRIMRDTGPMAALARLLTPLLALMGRGVGFVAALARSKYGVTCRACCCTRRTGSGGNCANTCAGSRRRSRSSSRH